MSALTDQLQQLKKQQAELEKRIQEKKEKERLVKMGLSHLKKLNDNSNEFIKTSGHRAKYTDVRTRRIIIFSTKEKFETLYEIIKKQDKKINTLESELNKLKEEFEICFASKYAMNGGTEVYFKAH